MTDDEIRRLIEAAAARGGKQAPLQPSLGNAVLSLEDWQCRTNAQVVTVERPPFHRASTAMFPPRPPPFHRLPPPVPPALLRFPPFGPIAFHRFHRCL
jgi:hypothetical protein